MALQTAVVLSGVEKEFFNDDEQIDVIYTKGARLLKTSSETSIESGTSQESGFSSLSSSEPASILTKDLTPYFNLLYRTQNEYQGCCSSEDNSMSDEANKSLREASKHGKIWYENRNILDLGANLRADWSFQPAQLQNGIQYFFENRSQYSRLLGAEIPPHYVMRCDDNNCLFEMPIYL